MDSKSDEKVYVKKHCELAQQLPNLQVSGKLTTVYRFGEIPIYLQRMRQGIARPIDVVERKLVEAADVTDK